MSVAWHWNRLRAMQPGEVALHFRKKLRQQRDSRELPKWRNLPLEPSGAFPKLPDRSLAPVVLRETLATPIQKLHIFERNSAIPAEKKPHLFMPADLRGGCREHVEYVVEALRLLGQRESQTSHQAA